MSQANTPPDYHPHLDAPAEPIGVSLLPKPVSLTLLFPPGNYRHALACYHKARDWIMENGLPYLPFFAGRLNHPVHSESPLGERFVPHALAEKDGWELTVDLTCETQDALDIVRALPLPMKKCVLVEDETRKPSTL